MFFLHLLSVALCENTRGPIQTPVAYPLSIPTRLMNKTGEFVCSNISLKCPQNHFEEPFVYSYYQICWSSNGNATFSYTFRGIQFLIYGRHHKAGMFNLFVDNIDLGIIIEKQNDEKVTNLLYISNIYNYGDHTIRVVGKLGQYFEIFKFAFWPEFKVKRLNMSKISSSGKWISESENIGCTHENSDEFSGAKKSIIIEASKFWLYGTTAPHHGKLQIKYNALNHIVDTSSAYHEFKLLFESEKMDLAYYTLDLIALDCKNVLIYCVYYQNDHLMQEKSFHQLVSYFKFVNISYNYLVLIGLSLAVFVAIIVILINIAKNYIDNTFIFVILGDSSSKLYESTYESVVLKYLNYSFTTYALLIKRLAIKHLGINKQHIGIFGKGREIDFDISTILQNNKIVIQLTIDEIYTTKYWQSELNLIPFRDANELCESIKTYMKPFNCKKPNIIIFLYDHGTEKTFGNLNFLDLYFGLMDIPHHSLQIYNDSCKSNSMLITIKNFYAISKIINSYSPILSQTELFFLASAAEILYPRGNYIQWDLICSLDRKYYNYITKENHRSFNFITSSNNYFEVQDKKYSNDFISNFSNDEINSLIEIAKSYKSEYFLYPDNYDEIHKVFKKGAKVIKKALIDFNCSIAEFKQILDNFKSNKENFMNNIHLKNPKNHSIVTSTHESGASPTFGTLRVNKNIKIIPGSPCMGAYIIEALMNRSLGQKSIDSIKKRVYGNYDGLIFEYATQSNEKRKKNWIRLFINYWESNSFSKKKIISNQYNIRASIEDIMKSVDFHLLCSCQINFKNNYCTTKKMQPFLQNDHSRKTNVIGLRLVDINQEYDYSVDHFDDEDYYSDNNNNQSNTLDYPKSSAIDQSTSFENIFDSVDYDMIIPSDYVQKVSQDIKILKSFVYSRRVLEVFKYELQKIEESQRFINKYQCSKKVANKEIPYQFKDNLIDWISHFFPTYIIFYEEKELMYSFYEFTVKYDIPKNDCKQIFYKCMNVADQVASQLSIMNKKTAYNEERIKSNAQNL